MRKLFLSSAGIRPETKDAFIELLGKDPHGIKVGFIPTACDPEPDHSYVQWTIDQIENLGMKCTTVDLKGENEDSLYGKLQDYDVICINGGNTFYLMDWVRKSGFDKVIIRLLDESKIYFGVSAGSYIVCPTIEAAGWKHADRNVVGLKDLKGLNLVPFIITAHYNKEKYRDSVEYGAKKAKLPVVALYDTQALIVEDGKYKVVGQGPKEFFNGFKEKL